MFVQYGYLLYIHIVGLAAPMFMTELKVINLRQFIRRNKDLYTPVE